MRRRPALLPSVLVLLLIAAFMAAGVWQMARARYKVGLQEAITAAAAEPPLPVGAALLDASQTRWQKLVASGVWLSERTILLDNKIQDGVVGYEVVTPLKLSEDNRYLLVDRGWVRAPALRSELPAVSTPTGLVRVEGMARVPSHRFIELGADVVSGPVWQNLTIERYAAWSNLPLQPVLLYQHGGADDGLLRVEPALEVSGLGADRHRGYALTWFSLAAVTLIMGLLSWYRNTNGN